MFVVHSSSLNKDIEYWNAARKATGIQAPDMEWWGICDSGRSCDAYQDAAQFSIVAFMSPYQMRILANADAEAVALLYDGKFLRGKVEQRPEPGTAAEAILRLRK